MSNYRFPSASPVKILPRRYPLKETLHNVPKKPESIFKLPQYSKRTPKKHDLQECQVLIMINCIYSLMSKQLELNLIKVKYGVPFLSCLDGPEDIEVLLRRPCNLLKIYYY